MLENKKIRNPFPKIGLVFKYEFLSGIKKILPVYSALLVLSLVAGIMYTDKIATITNDTVKIILALLMVVTSFVAFILTIVFVEKRFKKSMLQEEAYLNLTLPVTTGEHIVGRLLAYFVWAIIYCAVCVLSSLLTIIREWKNVFNGELLRALVTEFHFQTNINFFKFMFMMFLFIVSLILLFVMFIFFVNTISHLVKKFRVLIELASIVVLFVLFGRLLILIMPASNISSTIQFTTFIWRFILLNFVTVIVEGIATSYMLKFRFNLEA